MNRFNDRVLLIGESRSVADLDQTEVDHAVVAVGSLDMERVGAVRGVACNQVPDLQLAGGHGSHRRQRGPGRVDPHGLSLLLRLHR